ncbi:MAG: hypothetical protein ACJ77N_08010 [Chloroflexota bacterium]|jgi:hypothetical protein
MTTNATDAEEHLRAASDAILLLVREVDQLERHKRGIHPGEPRFDELATDVRRAAQYLAEFTEQEEAWARGASARGPMETISESVNPSPLSEILARWRAVERQLDEAEPGSPEASALFEEFGRIRDEYMTEFRSRAHSSAGDTIAS